jgi:hypothetical protein
MSQISKCRSNPMSRGLTLAITLILALGSAGIASAQNASKDAFSDNNPSQRARGGAAARDGTGGDSYKPPLPNEILVSDRDFNHFVFPLPIANGPIFPAGSPLLGDPVYLAGNSQILLQFQKGADGPIHMVVELQNGAVHKFYLKPRPINGVTHRVDGASEKRPSGASREMRGSSPRGADIDLLRQVVQNGPPSGFERIALPPPTRFDKFTVVPLSGWSDGNRRIMTFNLVAVPGQTAVVAPPQFYRDGVSAVLLDGDVVDGKTTPTLYVVEEVYDDE